MTRSTIIETDGIAISWLCQKSNGRDRGKLQIHVFLIHHDQALVHPVQQVDVLHDQEIHFPSDSRDVCDNHAENTEEDECDYYHLEYCKLSRHGPCTVLIFIYQRHHDVKDNSFRGCEDNSSLSRPTNSNPVDEEMLLSYDKQVKVSKVVWNEALHDHAHHLIVNNVVSKLSPSPCKYVKQETHWNECNNYWPYVRLESIHKFFAQIWVLI